ncbi:putative 3-oxo-5-alpha-steroid 4-dehydrogenase [Blattamonas nauphoetae]|uniref:3-oxo-5-alpha-steroid 4-dehydrogenase n=1 Tax=Blattamonas nauphoetae TaxID=2049346 RepID=A0ABQ9XAT5_9EUKA|nr:putative 3-oxo-5-alpha-steroid 4-dehydrogenase [Blattamonas nauphoetae]
MAIVLLGQNLLQSNLLLALILVSIFNFVMLIASLILEIDKLHVSLPVSVITIILPVFTLSLHFHFRQVLVFTYTLLWALYMLTSITIKHFLSPRDSMFEKIRTSTPKSALIVVYLALLSFIYSLPVLIVSSIRSEMQPAFHGLDVIGSIFFTLGFLLETSSTAQLLIHKQRHRNSKTVPILNTQLWKYNRHPNHVGHVLAWWGIFLQAAPALFEWEWLLVLVPLFIHANVLFGAGIPISERSLKHRYGSTEEYKNYMNQTSRYFVKFHSTHKTPTKHKNQPDRSKKPHQTQSKSMQMTYTIPTSPSFSVDFEGSGISSQ